MGKESIRLRLASTKILLALDVMIGSDIIKTMQIPRIKELLIVGVIVTCYHRNRFEWVISKGNRQTQQNDLMFSRLTKKRFLDVDPKKFLAGIGVFHVLKQKWQVNSNNVTNELKVSSISILANGLVFALEFECANAVLKLIIVI